MKKLLAPLAVAAVAVGALAPAANAAETTTVTVRQSDFISAASDTRATGHVDFLKDGLHIWTEGSTSTDKAAEYFAYHGSAKLADLSGTSLEWFGTNAAPSTQIAIDKDGNGTWDGYMVGEKLYWDQTGTECYWSGSSAIANDPNRPQGQNCGGYAAQGTLAEWKSAYPLAKILYVGFSLGSGVKGDGVLRSATFGANTYEFTSEPAAVTPAAPAVVDVTAKSTVTKSTRKVRIVLVSNKLAANTVQGKKVHWTVSVDGKVAARYTQGAGERDVFVARFAKKSGKHVITLTKNGKVVRSVKARA